MNRLRKKGASHSSALSAPAQAVGPTSHVITIGDCLETLRRIPTGSIQLVICDPPYNVNVAAWDDVADYVDWAASWIREVERVLAPSGNFVMFGGLQYQSEVGSGDLLSLMSWMRRHSEMLLANLIIWTYPNGVGAQRFFGQPPRGDRLVRPQLEVSFRSRRGQDQARSRAGSRSTSATGGSIRTVSTRASIRPTSGESRRLNGNAKERVGHPTQKPRELIARLMSALSYPGSTVLDFFAGSGVTGRVAIETGRHSISGDADPQFLTYIRRHLDQIAQGAAVPEFTLIEGDDWSEHPVFG